MRPRDLPKAESASRVTTLRAVTPGSTGGREPLLGRAPAAARGADDGSRSFRPRGRSPQSQEAVSPSRTESPSAESSSSSTTARLAVVLRYYADMSYEEIAGLGIRPISWSASLAPACNEEESS
jgi:hypothetical protein